MFAKHQYVYFKIVSNCKNYTPFTKIIGLLIKRKKKFTEISGSNKIKNIVIAVLVIMKIL